MKDHGTTSERFKASWISREHQYCYRYSVYNSYPILIWITTQSLLSFSAKSFCGTLWTRDVEQVFTKPKPLNRPVLSESTSETNFIHEYLFRITLLQFGLAESNNCSFTLLQQASQTSRASRWRFTRNKRKTTYHAEEEAPSSIITRKMTDKHMTVMGLKICSTTALFRRVRINM